MSNKSDKEIIGEMALVIEQGQKVWGEYLTTGGGSPVAHSRFIKQASKFMLESKKIMHEVYFRNKSKDNVSCETVGGDIGSENNKIPKGWSLNKTDGEVSTITIRRESDGAWCGGGIKGEPGATGLRYDFLESLMGDQQ